MSTFPVTSFTLISKIKDLPPGEDGAAWARFWELYAPAMRAFATFKGAGANADDVVMAVFGKLVNFGFESRQARRDCAIESEQRDYYRDD
jgi:hypothetical protein